MLQRAPNLAACGECSTAGKMAKLGKEGRKQSICELASYAILIPCVRLVGRRFPLVGGKI
jgi:hypothetical protein